jgi:glycosyltransferase involved in cell wall biosynthesis
MTNTPRVSVILPAYNRETLVARAIDSVLAQTYGDFELIIVDDASKDGTRAVLETYRTHPKVRLILSDVNRGGSGARNLGIAEAKGALIAFQDSDDVWMPHKLAAQVAALDANPKAGLCYCGSLFSSPDRTYYIPEPVFDRLEGDLSSEILRRNTTSTQVLLIRREVLDKAGHFDASLKRFQDWDLMIRVAQITEIAFLSEPMVVIFATAGNISSFVENDAIARAQILEKYQHIFRKSPKHAARNHYITGRVWQRLGQQTKARGHLRQALELEKTPKIFLTLMRSFVS